MSRFYFSPYDPTNVISHYLKDDYSRKPHPSMIIQAQMDLAIYFSCSLLIGDKVSDIQAGNTAVVDTNLLFTLQRQLDVDGIKYYQIANFSEAVPYLKAGSSVKDMR